LAIPGILADAAAGAPHRTRCFPTFNTVYNVGVAIDLQDPEVFQQAYAQHRRGVYATAYRVLGNTAQAQDVVQDVFLRIWRKPRSFDSRRGELGAYLRLMARSRALDIWREAQAGHRAGDRLRRLTQEFAMPVGDAAVRGEIGGAVRAALDGLPAAQREALVLAYWGGLTADEIARHVQIPLGTAKSRIRLGLQRMRNEPAFMVAVS
jgi:RNA polymerase sigma-70 factor (ECF subfamily)